MEKTKNNTAWVARKLNINLSAKHSKMLDELVAKLKQDEHRTNITSTIERAIENLHAVTI